MLAYVLEHALDAGEESVKRGPELLPVLRDAGVVDAGGYGLTIIFAGIVAALRGADPPPLEHHAPARVTHPAARVLDLPLLHELRRHRRTELDAAPWIERWSGSATRCSSSATPTRSRSTSTPTSPSARPSCSTASGAVSRLDVADMHEQVQRAHRAPGGGDPGAAACSPSSPATACARCSRASAPRARRRPDAEPVDLRAAGRRSTASPPSEVVVLPNSPNVLMAAERAAELSEKTVRVVAVALDAGRPRRRRRARSEPRRAPATRPRWRRRSRTSAPGGVAEAARDDTQGRFRRGDAVGFIEEQIVAWGEPRRDAARSCSASSAARPSCSP